MLDRLLKRGFWHIASVVFLVSFALRLFLDALFQMHFGAHAVNHLETWLYTGVMEGTHLTGGGAADPVVWLLRAIGIFVPAGLEFYAVIFTSAVLSSLTAAAIFFLASELYDTKTGFAAGMTYGVLVEPLALCMSGFTHDHVQLLVMVSSMLFAVKAAKSGLKGGILWSSAYIAVAQAGKLINYSINLIIGVTLLYVCYALLEFVHSRLFRRKSDILYPIFISVVVLGLFAFGRTTLPSLVEGELSALPQGRMGSADVVPVTLMTFWLRYNALLFLLPFGIMAAYRRRDVFGISLTIIGFMLAGIMDRGTRIGDLGVALLFAYAIVDWGEAAYKKMSQYQGSKAGYVAAAVLIAVLARLCVDYALQNDASMPENLGWSFGLTFYALLASSAVLTYLLLAKTLPDAAGRLKGGLYSMKNAVAGLAVPLTRNQRMALLLVIVALAALFNSSVVYSAVMAYRLVVFFSSAAAPVSLSLLTYAALPALLSAYLSLLAVERYMRKSWWASGAVVSVLIAFYMAAATLFTIVIMRLFQGKSAGGAYLFLLFISGALALAIGFPPLRAKATLAYSAIAFTYAMAYPLSLPNPNTTPLGSLVIFAAGGAMLLHIILNFRDERRILPAVAAILLVSAALNVYYVYTVEPRKVGPNAEYEVLKWLSENKKDGKILTAWDHGYMAEVVSGLPAVSTPGWLDNRTHDILWMPERQAAKNFNNKGVRYILLNNETFNMVRDRDGRLMYRLMGGLIMEPHAVPAPEVANRYTIYKLRHNMTEGSFTLIKAQTDPVTGMQLLLYEVAGEPAKTEGNLSLIGGVAVNVGGNKTVRMLVSKTETNGTYNRTYYQLANESFQDGQIKDVLYAVKGLNGWDCRLRPAPPDGRLWNYTVQLAYLNIEGGRDVNISARLVSPSVRASLRSLDVRERFEAAQKRTVPLVFTDVDEWGEYAIDLVPARGLSLLENETTDPRLEDVRIMSVFC